MQIICLRTGKILEKDLTITTASTSMINRIAFECRDMLAENRAKIIAKYLSTGNHPFMFDVKGNK